MIPTRRGGGGGETRQRRVSPKKPGHPARFGGRQRGGGGGERPVSGGFLPNARGTPCSSRWCWRWRVARWRRWWRNSTYVVGLHVFGADDGAECALSKHFVRHVTARRLRDLRHV